MKSFTEFFNENKTRISGKKGSVGSFVTKVFVYIIVVVILINDSNYKIGGGVSGLPAVIKIGAIFTEEQKDSSIELAFKYAVYKINKDKWILPKTTLVYDVQYVPKDDSFRTSKKGELFSNIYVHILFITF